MNLPGGLLNNHRAILPLELQWFCNYFKNYDVNRIIESGTYHGSSAIRLAEYFPNYKTITFEKVKSRYKKAKTNCKDYKNIKCVLGEINLKENDYDKHTVVLIDGPKRERAIYMAFKLYKKVAFVGIHDMKKYCKQLEEKFNEVIYCPQSTHGFVIVKL